MAGHGVLAAVDKVTMWRVHGFNKICLKLRTEASRFGVGESSGELVVTVHC